MNTIITPIIFFGTCFFIIISFSLLWLIYDHKNKLRHHKLELSASSLRHERELLNTEIEVRDQALTWASREFHDNIGQVLTITKFDMLWKLEEKTKEQFIKDTRTYADRIEGSLRDLKQLSRSLNGNIVERMGLQESIQHELSYIRKLYSMDCSLHFPYDLPELTNQQNTFLFRIIQESLNNIIRHAQASKVEVTLESPKSDDLILKIADNGVGIKEYPVPGSNGLGLINMEKRAELMHGTMEVKTAENKGCLITITIKNTQNESG